MRKTIGISFLAVIILNGIFFIDDPLLVLALEPPNHLSNYRQGPPAIRLNVQHGHKAGIRAVAISPNKQLVVSGGGDGTAILWELFSGRELRRFVVQENFSGTQKRVNALVFSMDGQYILTGSGDGIATLWEVSTGQKIRSFDAKSKTTGMFDQGITAVAITPSGHRIWTGSKDDQVVREWDKQTGRELRRISLGACRVSGMDFSLYGHWAVAGCFDGTAQLWDLNKGRVTQLFKGHTKPVYDVAVSPNGRWIVTGSGDNTVSLWDGNTGKAIRQFSPPVKVVSDVAISANGRWIMAGSDDNSIWIWNQFSKNEAHKFRPEGKPNVKLMEALAFSADDKLVLAGGGDYVVRLWDRETGIEMQNFSGSTTGVEAVTISGNSRSLILGGADGSIPVWDLTTGKMIQRLTGHTDGVMTLSLSKDNSLLASGGKDHTVRLWNRASGKELRNMLGHLDRVPSLTFSPDSNFIFSGSGDNSARLWETSTGKERLVITDHKNAIRGVAFSLDGSLLTGSWDGTARLWNSQTGQEIRSFGGGQDGVYSVAISPNGEWVVLGYQDGKVVMFSLNSGQEVRRFKGHKGVVGAVVFSQDGHFIVTGSWDGTVRVWDPIEGHEISLFNNHIGVASGLAIAPDSRWVVSASGLGTTRLWEPRTGKEIVQIIPFEDRTWAVVAPDGRFDTNNLEQIKGLNYVAVDDPLHALPLEIFMRDYYEPRLLPRLLAGEPFPPIRSLAELNRVQPGVQIAAIGSEPGSPDLVTVTVEIEKGKGEFHRNGQAVTVETGVYDLRLFRDGQLVGTSQSKSSGPQLTQPLHFPNDEMALFQWRNEHKIAIDPKTGKATLTFKHIRLPRRADLKAVEFSAYAFNEDRVKSATARYEYELPQALPTVKGRAYLITVGVNEYENSAWDLNFSAQDARRIQEVLSARLNQNEQYQEEVVQIPLLADSEVTLALGQMTSNDATKAKIKGVLDLLAGRPIDTKLKQHIPKAADILPARPEDLVLISFSSHGHTDTNGTFYFFPSDIGQGHGRKVTQALLQHTISSEELSHWLQEVDAGDLVLIVDACHSAATVEAGGFKPGPMGSRGLGQLAYDKGMRILVASQAEDVALESRILKQGLLSYALVQDGLEAQRADFQPEDQTIFLKEWLEYAVQRVPKLFTEVKNGTFKSRGTTAHFGKNAQKLANLSSGLQQPSLFDFRKDRRDVVVSQLPAVTDP